ncbi:hypothetical protein BCR36DRAFT_373551 [Piromyces finnis]|uniref:Uncharacterized protein n=1 Tax=Piromyces finnis TaxID=1754191 RepID=A0A1Y1V0A7_9FUNG|nr:hypothetical protein BCR36DRAFT_373551 [Piromyces finnis]|eukprot:ORX43897.1 hypothetical protein BCR36DRAFT_373551 [Piromyces finnis]
MLSKEIENFMGQTYINDSDSMIPTLLHIPVMLMIMVNFCFWIRIPNYKVKSQLLNNYSAWIKENSNLDLYNDFVKAVLQENVTNTENEDRLNESNFHKLVMGLFLLLGEDYKVKTNRESETGRYDICIIPRRNRNVIPLGIIIEMKKYLLLLLLL